MAMLPGADPGEVGLCTSDAPADDAGQEPAVVLFAVNHQGPSGVALEEENISLIITSQLVILRHYVLYCT